MKGLFIPGITAEMFRNGCLESIEALMAEGEMYDIDYSLTPEIVRCKDCKHREEENGFCEGRGWPMQLVPDDGFCEKGEMSLSFKTFQHLCKYYHVGYDQDRFAHDTCRYEANIPSGCSWGECNLETCPFLQDEEGAGNDKF